MGRFVSKPLLSLALAGALAPGPVSGDDGGLYHQQRLQQHKSQFQLMLEQLNERSRQRARDQRRSGGSGGASSPVAASLGQGHQPLRLGIRLGRASSATRDPAQTPQRIQFREEGQQRRQRILDEQQRRRALVTDRDAGRGLTSRVAASKRLRLNNSRVQQQQRSLQRKLTY